MSDFLDAQKLVALLFLRLRKSGFDLGVGEYFAALEAVEGGYGRSRPVLQRTLKLMWCTSRSQQSQFDLLWEMVIRQLESELPPPVQEIEGHEFNSTQAEVAPSLSQATPPPVTEVSEEPEPDGISAAPLPVRPPFVPAEVEELVELQTYWPISHRDMLYAWRYLRRMVPGGPVDVLDVSATVERTAREGFFLAPVYHQRDRNEAGLILFVDQNGSMMPFHRYTRDLVDTAKNGGVLHSEQVAAFYFQNVPGDYVYADRNLMQPVALERVLEQCDRDTSMLIVSDAGAARGYRKLARLRATTAFVLALQQRASAIAWLNPMPRLRWKGSSAELVAGLVPMFPMNEDGFSQAIDVARGQVPA
ncbi:hypothetical protein KR51_00015670 [Rubidibacter lacunae KORDI 51-2]|uniref:VWA domain containing CoxE-like protein n=1 Tax=Rubidibacter lacunae KORDI 51-2 TaxID=582515 RepID=U5DJ58_9CHRO|nr:hypothetical protein [Rubidibacter lacunae]ERN41721.1 hypothetical protein KR51_00015670 [Rubidibacter lacunae KORDI 51-2]